MRRAALIVAVAIVSASIFGAEYGCGESHQPPAGCGDGAVDLFVVADGSLSDAAVASIASFDVFSVSMAAFSDASSGEQDTFAAGTWTNRQQLFRYHPPLIGGLDVSVTARDRRGSAVAFGVSQAAFADCGQIGVTIELSPDGPDMGTIDMRPVD